MRDPKRAATDSGDEVMTAPAAAVAKGVHRNSIHKAIKEGRLKATRSGKSWLIRRRDLDAWKVVGHRPRSSNGLEATGFSLPLDVPKDQRERAERMIRLLDDWLADESGYDEETWPKLKEALDQDRPSYRKLFGDSTP